MPNSRTVRRFQLTLAMMVVTQAANIATAFENSIGIKLVLIPAGEFTMGSPAGEKDRLAHENQRRMKISREFYLGAHEVTRGQFRRFATEESYTTDAEKDAQGGFGFNQAAGMVEGRDPRYSWRYSGWKTTDDHPVVNVSWNDAKAFCKWLTEREQTLLPAGEGLRIGCRPKRNGNMPAARDRRRRIIPGTIPRSWLRWPTSPTPPPGRNCRT